MQSIFNTSSLQARLSAGHVSYSVTAHGNIIAEICVSGQFIRFVNAGMLLYIDELDELKTMMNAIYKQHKELHPEQPA